jgi:guanylate kinase
MSQGTLLILCGPSGVGKSTLGRQVRASRDKLTLSVSCTTRPMRAGERDGVDYTFLSREDFVARREQGAFAEWAEVHGNLYGTPRSEIERAFKMDLDLLFDIDFQGARQLLEAYPQACCSVLVAPPSMATLEARLRGRATDSDEVIRRRLDAARHELEQFELFGHLIVNDDLERAVAGLTAIYDAARLRMHTRRGALEAILAG